MIGYYRKFISFDQWCALTLQQVQGERVRHLR